MNSKVIDELVSAASGQHTVLSNKKDTNLPQLQLAFDLVTSHNASSSTKVLDQARSALNEAFMGYRMMEWIAEPVTGDENERANREVVQWIVESCLRTSIGTGGFVLVVSDATTKKTLGACIVPYIAPKFSNSVVNALQRSWRFGMELYRMFKHVGTPPTHKSSNGWPVECRHRFDKLAEVDKKHYQLMGNTAHMYLNLIGVTKDARGYGVGTELMQLLNKIADAHALDTYLETNEDYLTKFYEKHGFQLTEEYVVGADTATPLAPNFGMTRPRVKKSA